MSEMPGDIWCDPTEFGRSFGTWEDDRSECYSTHYVLASRLEEALGEVEREKAAGAEQFLRLSAEITRLKKIIGDEPSDRQSPKRAVFVEGYFTDRLEAERLAREALKNSEPDGSSTQKVGQ